MTTDRIIRSGVVILLLVTPLLFGATEVWSRIALQISILILMGLWLIGSAAPYGLPHIAKSWKFIALMVFLMTWGILQLATSSSIDSYSTLQALRLAISYLLIFVLVVGTIKTKQDINGMVTTLMIIGFGISLFAIIQGYAWNGKVFWLREVQENRHVFGPFINHNHFAGYVGMLIPLGIGYLLSTFHQIPVRGITPLERLISRITHPEANRLILIFFFIVVMMVSLFLTLSRSGIVSVFVSIFAMALFLFVKSLGRKMVLPILVVCLSLVSLAWFGMGPLIRELATLIDAPDDPSLLARVEVWRDSLAILDDYPVMGTGLGTFGIAYPEYKSTLSQIHYAHAHNDYLQMLIETGWVGFLIVMLGLFMFIVSLMTSLNGREGRWGRGMLLGLGGSVLSIMIHSLTDFNLRIPANALLLIVIFAMSLNIILINGKGTRPIRIGPSIRIAGLVIILGLSYGIVAEGIADYYFRSGSQLEKRGETDGAISRYERAISWDPRVPGYHFALGKIYEQRWVEHHQKDDLWMANREIQMAVDLSPKKAEYRLHLGWIYAQKQDREKATEEFLKVIDLDPTNANWRHYVGLWFTSIGEIDRAQIQAQMLKSLEFEVMAREIEARL